MKIVRTDYSRSPWRLLNDEGGEIYWQKPMDHPDLGKTIVTMPICGDTKSKCIEQVLIAFGMLMNKKT